MSTLRTSILQRTMATNDNTKLAPALHNALQNLSFEQACQILETQDAMGICHEDYDTSNESCGTVNQCDGGVFLSPTRKRAASSISMSDVPSHMSSGQILPSEGLASACPSAGLENLVGAKTMTALEFLDMEDPREGSDPEDKAPLFDYEMGDGGVMLSGPSTEDKGKGKMVERCDEDGGVSLSVPLVEGKGKGKTIQYCSDSEDDDASGGVLIRDFTIEKDHRAEPASPFPKYNNKLAMTLLKLPEVPLTVLMPVATPEGAVFISHDAWTMVNMSGEVVQLPARRRRRTVLLSNVPFGRVDPRE